MADEERDLDAAERALGTETRPPQSAAEMADRDAWERRLAPLLDVVPPIEPPEGLFGRISGRIAVEDMISDLDSARKRVSRWKRATVLAGSVAAAIAVYVAVSHFQPPAAERYVAVVKSDADGRAGLIVQFDTGTGVATIVPVNIAAPEGRSLEMWHLPSGTTRPLSLGLLPDAPEVLQTLQAGPGDIFAISLEPSGGSPTGQPTEPVYHGRIVKVE